LEDLTRARADAPLLNDLRVTLPHLLTNLGRADRGEPVRLEYDPPTGEHAHALVEADAVRGSGTPEVGSPGARVSASTPDQSPANATRQDLGTRGPPPHPHPASSAPAAPTQPNPTGAPRAHVPLLAHG